MKKCILILCIPLLFACKNNTVKVDKCPSNIDSIFISYINYDFMNCFTPVDFNYFKNEHRPAFEKEYYGTEGKYYVDYKGVIDTVLTDCDVLASIGEELQKVTRCDFFINSIAVRLSMIVKYDNKQRDTLLFDGDYIRYVRNKEGYWGNLDLSYIIRKNIGFYSWQHKSDQYLNELDTLNRRDSIKIWIENNPKLQGAILDY